MLLIIPVLWIGSAISGWFAFFAWLAVPVVVFWVYTASRDAKVNRHARNIGMSGDSYRQQMAGPNLILIVWNTAINAGIFTFAWVLSTIF